MTRIILEKPSGIDAAEYNYLTKIPKSKVTLIDLIALSVLEEKYPELKS